MKFVSGLSAALFSVAAMAAPPKPNLMDHSAERLIDSETALGIMGEAIPAKVWKLYPPNKFTFASQVEGGMTTNGTCVITARVMLLPLTGTLKIAMMRPAKTATAFDSLPNSSDAQCKDLARGKLKEATMAVVSALVKV